MFRRPIKPFGVALLPVTQRQRFSDNFLAIQPSPQELRRNVEEDAFPELFDGRQPLEISRQICAVYGELYFIKLAFGAGRRRLQAREAVKAGDLPQAVNPYDVLQECVPRRLKLQGGKRKGLGVEEGPSPVAANDGSVGCHHVKLRYP